MAYPTVTGVGRVDLKYFDGIGNWGSRFFISFGAGIDTTDANLSTLAEAISAMWGDDMASVVSDEYGLVSIVVTDLTDPTSPQGRWDGHVSGSRGGVALPSNISTDMRIRIADRYRGGHPVMHFPPPNSGDLDTRRQFTGDFISDFTTQAQGFLSDVNSYEISGGVDITWLVLRGYRNDAVPEAVTPYPVTNVLGRQALGTMRTRVKIRA
jgi:hypothetical protein